ncbi:hypothetical protein FACS1894186_6280 [Alphaproteobacteria bacterium]|nr:hypothetical protein FACS1894186_6280 [Alphaproteobacteria bacterium]
MTKNTTYTVKIGQGGSAHTYQGGAGYNKGGNSQGGGNLQDNHSGRCNGGNGADYTTTSIKGGDSTQSTWAYHGGYGGYRPGGSSYNNSGQSAGGEAYSISGIGAYGKGGYGYTSATPAEKGGTGAVYVKLVR